MAAVSRPLSSCLLVLASLLMACGDTQPLTCNEVDCGPGTCEQLGELAVCKCPVEYVTTGLSCRSTDPGATREEATFLQPGSGQAVLSDKDDVDVFSFHVEAGRIYRFTCAVSSVPAYYFTCPARLTSESGEMLPTRVADGDIGYEATTTGTVYAEVRPYPFPEPTPFPMQYDYALKDVGPDEHGDTPETATLIFPSTEATDAEIQIFGDVDAFAFDAQAGHIYRFSSGSFPMRLRGPSGEVLSDALGINYEVTQSGRYTLETYVYADHLNRGVGHYSYKLEDLGLDDHGDTAETATELVPGATGQGWSETELDVDVFRFTAPAGRVVRFRCEIEEPTANKCRIDLRDSAGTLLLDDRQYEVTYQAGDTPVSLIAEVSAGATRYWYPRYTYRLEDLAP